MHDTALSDADVLTLLNLTNSMRKAVDKQRWDEVNELDSQRLDILNYVRHTISQASKSGISYSVEERAKLESALSESDRCLQKSVREQHQELVNNRRDFQARQQAMKNYISTSTLDREY